MLYVYSGYTTTAYAPAPALSLVTPGLIVETANGVCHLCDGSKPMGIILSYDPITNVATVCNVYIGLTVETDEYDTSHPYNIGDNVYCSSRGKFTSLRENLLNPIVGRVNRIPGLNNWKLGVEWIYWPPGQTAVRLGPSTQNSPIQAQLPPVPPVQGTIIYNTTTTPGSIATNSTGAVYPITTSTGAHQNSNGGQLTLANSNQISFKFVYNGINKQYPAPSENKPPLKGANCKKCNYYNEYWDKEDYTCFSCR